MKKVLITIVCLNIFSCLHSQGITLLYKNNTGWNDPSSWIQISTAAGQTPIQRVPTELDDVVVSKSLSGLSSATFITDNTNTEFFVGSNVTSGYRCRSMHITNTDFTFHNLSLPVSPTINTYTSNGGFVIIDSGSNVRDGNFRLHGGNPAITDLKILHSSFGKLFSQANWSGLEWDAGGRARMVGSSVAGFNIGSYSGGNIYADSCNFETNFFVLGDNSTDTILNSTITNNINNNYLKFFIGRNSNFVSGKNTILSFSQLKFTSSGSEFSGNVSSLGVGTGVVDFLQEDPANPLPNIINGNVAVGEVNTIGISGDLKISGDLSGFSDDFYNNPTKVYVNAQNVFEVAGVTNYQGNPSINNCVNNFCHYKMEFYGSTNSNIDWLGGFPIDTLIVNKIGCGKVTCSQSLYVSGVTKIERGQLALYPNDTIPYKFVCAGNVEIAKGGALFLHKNAAGVVANMALGGTLIDHNLIADSACAGFSNPYNGTVTFLSGSLPVMLIVFYGSYQGNAITLSWSTDKDVNAKYFTVEKSFDQVSFFPLTNNVAAGNAPSSKNFRYTDSTSFKAINYYRLKMLDAAGRITYSKTIAIAAPISKAITIFPIPVREKLFIKLPDMPLYTQIIITDAKGNYVRKFQVKVGSLDASVNTSGLPSGVYSITFQSGNLKNTKQFVKQ